MPDYRQGDMRNRLLGAMRTEDFEQLAPDLERVSLPVRQSLESPDQPIGHAYFLEDGMASIVARMGEDRDIEVGIAGREGMTGTAIVMGADRTPHMTFMQIDGWGWKLPASTLRAGCARSGPLQHLMLRYVQSMMVQTASTALANGRCKLEERLARWLLMSHDRSDGAEVRLTHEFLAVMLGVRRPGITDAMHILEGKGLIRATRGVVLILDRTGLEVQANGSYGTYESEYQRLLGG